MLVDQTKQKEEETSTLLVIGIGSDYRRDDAAGLLVARALTRAVSRCEQPMQVPTRVIECTAAGLELIDAWTGAGTAVLVDAVSSGPASGAKPGTIYCIDAHDQRLPGYMSFSTHDFSVADTIELARILGKMPPHLIVYGIEGLDFDHGIGTSEEVSNAIETVTARLLEYAREDVGGGVRRASDA
jgi:hydrogenase maturation protease